MIGLYCQISLINVDTSESIQNEATPPPRPKMSNDRVAPELVQFEMGFHFLMSGWPGDLLQLCSLRTPMAMG